MPQQKETVQYNVFICEMCTKQQKSIKGAKMSGWLSISSVEKNNLRLFEKKEVEEPYETFHIPDKKVLIFCDRNCASKYINNSIDLFLSEVADKKVKTSKRQEL